MIIVPHFGGWGNVPLARADDFRPIISGIECYLQARGLRTIVAPYRRVPVPFPESPRLDIQLGILTEMFGLHRTRARQFAVLLETIAFQNPDVRFILVGQSNGAIIVDEVMGLLPYQLMHRVFAVVAGFPFWRSASGRENVLYLNNDGHDHLVEGDLGEIIGVVLERFYQRLGRVIGLQSGDIDRVWYIPGHDYRWEVVAPAVTSFLDRQLIRAPVQFCR